MPLRIVVITEEATTQEGGDRPLPADRLFLGPFREVGAFVRRLRTARFDARCYILTTTHGFVGTSDPLQPYPVTPATGKERKAPKGTEAVLQAAGDADLLVLALPQPYLAWLARSSVLRTLVDQAKGSIYAVAGSASADVIRPFVAGRRALNLLPRAGVARLGSANQQAILQALKGLSQVVTKS